MENELTNTKEVAEPDAVVSGRAITGQKHGIETGIAGKTEGKSPHVTHKHAVIGPGIPYNGKISPRTIQETAQDPVISQKVAESFGDLIFSLFDRQDRIRDRIQQKIDRLDQRITKLEARRRSQ